MAVLSRVFVACLLISAFAACKSSNAPEADAALPDDMTVPPDAAPPKPDNPSPNVAVGAVQYASGHFAAVAGCSDDLCALSSFIKDARKQGAELANVPEGSADQSKSELAPAVGDKPATDSRWADGSIIKTFAKLAVEQKMIVVFNVVTNEDGSSDLHNTNIAVGVDGKVLARHYKIQLFGGETKYFKPGTSIDQSFFDSPIGRTGLLICADAQCVVTGMKVTADCSAESATLLKDYFSPAKKPDAILLSSYWTVGGTGAWAALNVQKKVATYGTDYVAAANTTEGDGKGGGIYDPTGNPIVQDSSGKPLVLVGSIPRVKK